MLFAVVIVAFVRILLEAREGERERPARAAAEELERQAAARQARAATERQQAPGAGPQQPGMDPRLEKRVATLVRHDWPMSAGHNNWYALIAGNQTGPLNTTDLLRTLKQQAHPATVPVWRPGYVEWCPACTVPELAQQLRPPGGPAHTSSTRRVAPSQPSDSGPQLRAGPSQQPRRGVLEEDRALAHGVPRAK